MTKYILSAITAFYGLSAFATDKPAPRCQKEVEQALPELAEEGGATAEDKGVLIRQLENGETHLDDQTARDLIQLLRARGTLAFSFSNDAGTWVTIVDFSNCVILTTEKILDI